MGSQEFKKNDSRAMMSDLVWNKSVSDSIILAGKGLLVKMFITLEPHHIF